jgi:hypothetical protein
MPQSAKPSKKSSNPKTTTRGNAGGGGNRPARAHRNDTPEAKVQQSRLSKTHPNAGSRRSPAARKDK